MSSKHLRAVCAGLIIFAFAAVSHASTAQPNIWNSEFKNPPTIKIPDKLIDALPSPIVFLQSSDRAGALLQQGIMSDLTSECRLERKHPGCDLPELIKKYENAFNEIGLSKGVQPLGPSATKPWDLTNYLSGNFMLLPTPNSLVAGIDHVANLFLLRDQIATATDQFYKWNISFADPYSTHAVLSRAFMRAYVLTSTPLGALGEVFTSIKCGLNHQACEVVKSLWGSVCSMAVEDHLSGFQNLINRFDIISSDVSSQKLTHLKRIIQFDDMIRRGHLTRATVMAGLSRINGDGLAGYDDRWYSDLTRSILVYDEFQRLVDLRENCSPYQIDLSRKAKAKFEKPLSSMAIESIDAVESAFQNYAIDHELGGDK